MCPYARITSRNGDASLLQATVIQKAFGAANIMCSLHLPGGQHTLLLILNHQITQ
jgi:hypothetical protein